MGRKHQHQSKPLPKEFRGVILFEIDELKVIKVLVTKSPQKANEMFIYATGINQTDSMKAFQCTITFKKDFLDIHTKNRGFNLPTQFTLKKDQLKWF